MSHRKDLRNGPHSILGKKSCILTNLEQDNDGSKAMVLSTIKMLMSQQMRGEALKILRLVVEQCRVQPGCLSSCIYEDLDEENVIMIEEMWQDEEALERHLRSEEYLNLLLVLEMALRQPEIRFDTISSSTGIETIEKARSHAG